MTENALVLKFTGERMVAGAGNHEPSFAQKMYQEDIARYAFASQFAQDADILDIGCGVGYGTHLLGEKGARSVIGMDPSEDAIEHARKFHFHPAATYLVQTNDIPALDKKRDLVTCFKFIEYAEGQDRMLAGIKSVLKDDGVLIVSTPGPHPDNGQRFYGREGEFENILASLKKHFTHVRAIFQKNYLACFIGFSIPDNIGEIFHLSDEFSLNSADYFIFVASNGDPDRLEKIAPVLSMDDDSHVVTLENDNRALKKTEVDHLPRIYELEECERQLPEARRLLAERSQRLAEIETLIYQLEEDNARLREKNIEANALRTELYALRYRHDHTQATLTRFRRSVSWKVTIPIRWIGRNFKKIASRGKK